MIYIVGAGPGHESFLTIRAAAAIRSAELVIANERIYSSLKHLNEQFICKKLEDIEQAARSSDAANICILLSGDTGFYSAAKSLAAAFPEAIIIGGLSSLQYLCMKLKTSWDDVFIFSLHGRMDKNKLNAAPHVCYNRKVFTLAEPAPVLMELFQNGLGKVKVSVGEDLSAPSERITTGAVEELVKQKFSSLSVMLFTNDEFVDRHERIADAEFIRSRVPMTKHAIRTLSLDALHIKPTDVIADIGSGTGAMSIEMARKAYQGQVFAIDKNEAAIELLKQNKEKFKAHNISIIHDNAMDALMQLPHVDKVFVGGGGGMLHSLVAALVHKNPEVRIVINAVSLETLSQAVSAIEENGMTTAVTCANIAHMEKLGAYSMMKAENPVYIISGNQHG